MTRYESWTRAQLIARLEELDDKHSVGAAKPAKESRTFDVLSKPRRKIALKFCYHGWEYNGLVKQTEATPLPTVEAVLEDALVTTRLIDADGSLEGCGFSRSGRTDKGVSAAGQVAALWVRSAVGPPASDIHAAPNGAPLNDGPPEIAALLSHLWPTDDELPYPRLLNRVLPPSIRVLSWSPVQDSFDARFSCIQRHYKYFFRLTERLSLPLMRDAAARLVGSHDFRNFCRIDGSKGIEVYIRKITEIRIDPVTVDMANDSLSLAPGNSVYVINVVGSGFLWHQVRHIASVLFHVGQGLEHPTVVSALINVDPAHPYPPFREDESAPAVVESKPKYEMAEALPLMLWDCGYRDEDLNWQADGPGYAETFIMGLDSAHTQSLVQTTLHAYFEHAAVSARHASGPVSAALNSRLFVDFGAGRMKPSTKYVPFLQRERADPPSVINERWRAGAGVRRQEKRRAKEQSTEIDSVD